MSESEAVISVLSESSVERVKDPKMLARMVIREGKPFKSSAIAAGYSETTAAKGLAFLVRVSGPVAEAVNSETASLMVGLDKLKPLAIQRLHKAIVNERDRDGMKAIELAGRFKETDWFVKNGGDVQIGIFAGLAEPGPAAEKAIDAYREED